MKKFIPLCCLFALQLSATYSYAQKYRNAEDTARLNKEFVRVSNELVDLNAKLTIAENDLPGYQSKVNQANNSSANAANESSNQASKATNGSMGDAKKAKRKADRAYGEAKDYENAKKRLNSQENRITKYKSDIIRRQKRIQDLDVMRIAINTKIMNAATPQATQ